MTEIEERNEKDERSGEAVIRAAGKATLHGKADHEQSDDSIRGSEVAQAALKQLITCAKAECSDCQLVPEPEEYQQCLQVIQTCRDILRESLGLPEEEEIAGDDFLRAADEDISADRSVYARSGAVSSRSEVERKAHGTETE